MDTSPRTRPPVRELSAASADLPVNRLANRASAGINGVTASVRDDIGVLERTAQDHFDGQDDTAGAVRPPARRCRRG